MDSSQSWESSGQLGLASGFMSQLKKHSHSQAPRAPKQSRKIKNAWGPAVHSVLNNAVLVAPVYGKTCQKLLSHRLS